MKLYTLATAGKRMQELLDEIARLRALNGELLEVLDKLRCCNCRSMLNDAFASGCYECRPARAAIAAAEEGKTR